jgi:DNA modification methylase
MDTETFSDFENSLEHFENINPENWINKIVQGDCLELLPKLKEDSVDITITSPPYNISTRINEGNIYDEYEDNLSMEGYQEFTFKVIDELLRVTRYYTFWNIQILSTNKLAVLNLLTKYKDNIKEICIWAKTACPPASSENTLSNSYELIIVLSKYDRIGKQFKRAFFDNRTKGQGNISNCIIRPPQHDNECIEHKATFPEWLPEFFIRNFSKEGDIVLDPFSGTGTTAYVSKMMNRKFIGFELSKNYCDFANKRLNQDNMIGLRFDKAKSFIPSQKRLEI